MQKSLVGLILVAILGALFAGTGAIAQTGSRVGSTTQPLNVVWLDEPSEISTIRALLQEGEVDEALKRARAFLKIDMPISMKYVGQNMLCSALTAKQEIDEAIEACNVAIKIYPNDWQAINNRGTAYFVGGKFAEAAADYRRALELNPESDIIKHNIGLIDAKSPPKS